MRILAFHSFLHFFLSCLSVWFTARLASSTLRSSLFLFFFFLLSLPTAPLLPRLRLRSLRGTLTRTLGRRVIRRGTCWRKQSPWVNTESDERVIVNWENRVRSLVISIVSDCRYLLSRRYSATTYLLPSSAIQFRERQSLRVHAPACVVYNLLHRIISVVK